MISHRNINFKKYDILTQYTCISIFCENNFNRNIIVFLSEFALKQRAMFHMCYAVLVGAAFRVSVHVPIKSCIWETLWKSSDPIYMFYMPLN